MISLNLTERDRILRIFEGREVDRVPWMPRIDHWYNFNRTMGSLPKEFRGLSLPKYILNLMPIEDVIDIPILKFIMRET